MKVTLKNGKDNVVDLDIVIPAKEAADAYNKAASKIAQSSVNSASFAYK